MTNQQKFIDQIAPLAVADMRKNKILASITIAQACLETGCGSSVLMMKYNAVFGIKSTQSWLNSGGKAYSATEYLLSPIEPSWVERTREEIKKLSDKVSLVLDIELN